MYTFGILAAFFLLISGIVFGKKLKQNQLFVVLIVVVGTLFGTCIVNGIVGMRIPYTAVLQKSKSLNKEVSRIITPTDTNTFTSYIEYNYEMEKDSSISQSLDMRGLDYIVPDEFRRIARLSINWLPAGDSIPRLEIWKEKRIVEDNNWISSIGLPKGRRLLRVYIPKDSIHVVLMKELNSKFFTSDERKLAELN
jgi:hypothetical protein